MGALQDELHERCSLLAHQFGGSSTARVDLESKLTAFAQYVESLDVELKDVGARLALNAEHSSLEQARLTAVVEESGV